MADLAEVADELYALAPAQFRAARDERADQARAAGDRDLADAIRKLRRPTVSAWLVNLLVREAPDQVGGLLGLAGPLREAQRTLAADQMRELSARRRQGVAAIAQHAKRLATQARQPVSTQVEREVEATFEAALADPDAERAVRSGCLARALSYAGLGGVDLSDAVAVRGRQWDRPLGGEGGRRQAPAQRDARAEPGEQPAARDGAAERRAREADRARQDLREASAAAREAAAELEEAEQQVAGARDRHRGVQQQIEDLERRLEQAQARQAQLAREVRDAQRVRDVATRSADAAQRRLARAKARAGRHDGGTP